jgi:uncharacterized protein
MVPDAERLTTPDGVALEAHLQMPSSPVGGLVVCHPHPLYGGDMENPVVVRIDEVCAALGLATLRFNFRGVGRSTGVHADGVAEQLDVEAGLAHVTTAVGAGRPVGLAGYSFGAVVAADVAPRHPELAGLALVAPPLARTDAGRFAVLHRFGPRLLIVAGASDEICPADAVQRLATTLPDATVHLVEGANHFFFGKLYPLGEAIAAWARRALLA